MLLFSTSISRDDSELEEYAAQQQKDENGGDRKKQTQLLLKLIQRHRNPTEEEHR